MKCNNTQVSRFRSVQACGAVLLMMLVGAPAAFAQARSYPKEIRGYKVERAAVEIKSAEKASTDKTKPRSDGSNSDQTVTQPASDAEVDQLITFGMPGLARFTPLGITLDIPIVVAPVKQGGHVEFLLFEDITVNAHSVEIDEYHRAFDLPKKRPLTLHEPLRFFISTPVAALAAVDEWSNSKETWPVTGRVYVCGKFKKFLLTFKRCVPVELELTMKNPLKQGK